MSSDAPFSSLQRVYYEDTDAAGIVYHANYLKFMERARTDLLRHIGMGHQVMSELGRVFAVTSADVRFRHPGRLDDEISVTVEISEVKRASLVFRQSVLLNQGLNNERVLCTGEFVVACLDSASMKPVSITKALRSLCLNVSNTSQV
ncbi:tol-pal system-associated acyl-CoA thioesterase [Endozoicomonas gorgoniicola]|uniref:Tol-pal system-associated acyl-CoA thioesterase n=1 Tax=Endozoicomonas gorgoniicola TaxID=1234144 RepID=A0ABT3MVU2_9GAMM|nr:tol-pal system-associated acyl-CoA thioesterase [Endozoicomonas gorgoniicola]MCW7553501.1 tol-pal system-associated acyl-CoA thioesterase [Endozoicomonas gorgoniicola]